MVAFDVIRLFTASVFSGWMFFSTPIEPDPRPVNWEDLGGEEWFAREGGVGMGSMNFLTLLNSSSLSHIDGFVRYGMQRLHPRSDNGSYLYRPHAAYRYRGCGNRIKLRFEYWSI